MAMIYRALLLVGIVLTARLCACKAHGGVGVGDGFSVELIHRDSVKSPYHDPALSAHDRVLAAVRRSTARAAALARSYTGSGVVSEVVEKPFESLMVVNVGTPPTRMLAIVDTGSNLLWLKCKPRTAATKCKPRTAAAPPSTMFDPSSSSTFDPVPCYFDACHALKGASCDASLGCKYHISYLDGTQTRGLLSTETFTFNSVPGGQPTVHVPKVNFGCSKSWKGTFAADGIVGLGPGNGSLIGQLGIGTTLGRRFSYCMVPYYVENASSALNFGARAAVTEPGAATTALIRNKAGAQRYTIVLESVKVGNSSFEHLSNVIVDSGSVLTFLDKGLIDPIVEELRRRIGLPTVKSPSRLLQLCYGVSTFAQKYLFETRVPDMTLYLAVFGEAVTLKVDNTFAEVREGIMCFAMVPVTKERPVAVLGHITQQNMHVGYDLDKGTVTFAPADCARSYNSWFKKSDP
uniref:Uncharacterized protein n=1 Tax=Avena sativa TaxID=4498 RepID=A0ACD5VFI0_AVESA